MLPALHHEGTWVSGYGNVVAHLVSHGLAADLDAHLAGPFSSPSPSPSPSLSHSSPSKADHVAYTAYLTAHVAPLLDASLYVSAANWSATVRPAYSQLLPFPLTWTVPPLVRADAVARAEHLGLARLDADFDPNGGLHLSAGRDALPETFRRHLPVGGGSKGVRESMTPEEAAAIRLFGITEASLSVLEDALGEIDAGDGEGGFLGGDRVSSLDCLASAYLTLMRDVPVPRPFLRDWLTQKSPRLCAYIDAMKANHAKPTGHAVAAREQVPALGVAARTLKSCVLNAPGLGEQYANELRHRAEQGIKGLGRRAMMIATGLLSASAALGYGYLFYKSLQPFGSRVHIWRVRRSGSKLDQFGDLGSMLNSAFAPQPTLGGFSGQGSVGRLVETDSELG